MRLSEKTLELNFCSQFAAACPSPILWYGLTQLEEAELGFDVATRVGGTSVLFQVKASAHTLVRSGRRQFRLPHDQLEALRALARPNRPRRVFYVFPLVGTTGELAASGGLVLANSWLLDVSTLVSTPAPTKKDGTPRLSNLHYADVQPYSAIVHSEPVDYKLISALGFAEDPIAEPASPERTDGANDELANVARELKNSQRSPWGRLVAGVILTNVAAG